MAARDAHVPLSVRGNDGVARALGAIDGPTLRGRAHSGQDDVGFCDGARLAQESAAQEQPLEVQFSVVLAS